MIILAQRCQKVVDVKILLIDGDRTLCHFSAVVVAHKLVKRIKAWNDVAVFLHLFKEHRQCGTKLTRFCLCHAVVFRLPECEKQRLDRVLFLNIKHPVFGEKRIERNRHFLGIGVINTIFAVGTVVDKVAQPFV